MEDEKKLKIYIENNVDDTGSLFVHNKPIARLNHEPTKTSMSVYKPINVWYRFWLRLCFGLKYEKFN